MRDAVKIVAGRRRSAVDDGCGDGGHSGCSARGSDDGRSDERGSREEQGDKHPSWVSQ